MVIKNFLNLFLLLSSLACAYAGTGYLNGKFALLAVFTSGLFAGIFLMNLKLNVKNNKISSYKRELEKESISASESDARVKVLEAKIEVLEKALDKSLGK